MTGILPSSTNDDINNATQIQQEIVDREIADVNQMIEKTKYNYQSSYYFISRFCKEMYKDENNDDDDFEEELMLISLNDVIKSLQNWIFFFEQQQIDEFRVKDLNIFKKYLNLIKQIEWQS
ncbi:unnamed protein product [Rhizophagus irregularis]|nr:unnamed protein product [Rhizophagus irregularis]